MSGKALSRLAWAQTKAIGPTPVGAFLRRLKRTDTTTMCSRLMPTAGAGVGSDSSPIHRSPLGWSGHANVEEHQASQG